VPTEKLVAREAAQDPAAVPVSLSLQAFVLPTKDRHSDSIECSTCHKEHHGLTFDLKSVSNVQCQTCHQTKFRSFSDGHPPLGRYPYSRRTPIIFDHERHFSRHFPEADQSSGLETPSSCHHCHSLGAEGQLMEVRSFQTTCAGCHTDDLDGQLASGIKGIPFFSLPGLDTDALLESELSVGGWPSEAESGLLGLLPLLAGGQYADAESRAQLETLDGLDLSEATQAQRQAVQRWALATKSFLHRYQTEGAQTMVERIKGLVGDDRHESELVHLGALIPKDVIDAAIADWFPQLPAEMARHQRGQPVGGPVALDVSAARAQDKLPTGAGKDVSDDSQDILSSTSEESILGANSEANSGEDSLAGLSSESAGADILTGSSDTNETATENILAGLPSEESDKDILGSTSDEHILGVSTDTNANEGSLTGLSNESAGTDILGGSTAESSGEGILADQRVDQPQADLLSARPNQEAIQDGLVEKPALADSGLLSTTSGLVSGLSETVAPVMAKLAQPSRGGLTGPTESVEADTWARYGGWFRDGATLYYRPVGHADPVLKGWLGVLTSLESSHSWTSAVLETLRSNEYPGRCTKCHSSEQGADTRQVIHWRPRVGVKALSRLTVFSHKTHFPMLSEEGCTTCHQLNPEVGKSYLESYEHGDINKAVSNFSPIKVETCASCHVPQRAGDRCTTCHRYHPEGSVVTRIKGAFPTAEAERMETGATH